MKQVKICFVVSSITNNGVTRVLSILLNEIDYALYDVSVLLTKRVMRSQKLNENALIIEGQPEGCSGITGKIKTINSIHKILKKEQFEKIIALGNYAAIYMLLGSVGIYSEKIISERNDPNREPGNALYRKIRDLIYRSADVMVCQTHDASEYYKNIIQERIVIYNPIKPNLPVYDGIRDHRIVNFCRIDSQKNLPMLFDSFAQFHESHEDYYLEVYGNGPLEKQMEEYLTMHKMNSFVRMLAFSPDIHEKIVTATAFVSTSDFEGMSNSMIEAMGMGMPVICTDCPIGGAHEIIKSGTNGILIPCNDRNALFEALIQIVDNPKYAESLGEKARNIRETLDKDKIFSQWLKILS